HAPAVAFETGDSVPTTASSPVPTPTRFEATGLRYQFIAFDAGDLARVSPVKEWTAKIRLKYQLHHRGDHDEVELQAFPKANGITIRYTTDGSAPTSAGAATYDGKFRVPANARVVCAVAVAPAYAISSETVRIPIPQVGDKGAKGPKIDLEKPAAWKQLKRLDDSTAVWDFITRLELKAGTIAYDLHLTAESEDGHQSVDYSGALVSGYDAGGVKAVADKLQDLVSGGSLRLSVGTMGFPTGQALLDWLKENNQPFDISKVTQPFHFGKADE
ncbi:MAG: chitobiase/beta-hexosaminidase C-terminal domain-containing protein, partial [Verrucomicrobia bacterium]|nr:chitobiase/beta-hexosaminidase C-terminal domain-containing protein [Verrucomicrobiota bacterium]